MSHIRFVLPIWALLFSNVLADVVVLANRTLWPVEARIVPHGAAPYGVEIETDAVLPIACEGPIVVSFQQSRGEARYELDANAAYYFGRSPGGRMDLRKIGLGGDDSTRRGRKLPGETDGVCVIGVSIAVDEEEAAKRTIWEKRLRRRINSASDILERHFRVRLEIVGVTTWNSDNRTTEFVDSLVEFEREVDPRPGRLAIGFTSQYRLPRGRTHLGGTRGPLSAHILIREWSQHIDEPERLELLVHELGHYFGAAHSPEKESVMRPVLGDRKSIRADFAIRFDPVNTLIGSMVAEEVRRRGAGQMFELSVGTKRRLRQIYGSLEKAIPDDASARLHRRLLDVRRPSRQWAVGSRQ